MHPRGGLRRAARSALIPRRGDRLPPVSDVAPPHSRSSSCRGVLGYSNCESAGLRKDRTCSASNVTARGCATRLRRSIRTHTPTSRHAVYRPDFILGARQGRCDQQLGAKRRVPQACPSLAMRRQQTCSQSCRRHSFAGARHQQAGGQIVGCGAGRCIRRDARVGSGSPLAQLRRKRLT